MFEPRSDPIPDYVRLECLARQIMGWDTHKLPGHRPGSRAIPHAWRWHRGTHVQIMVYIGGTGEEANVEFDPISHEATAREMVRRMIAAGIPVPTVQLNDPIERADFCRELADRLAAEEDAALIAPPAVEMLEPPTLTWPPVEVGTSEQLP